MNAAMFKDSKTAVSKEVVHKKKGKKDEKVV
jgi:hypothetical protein